jgi:hypothetical protein
MARFRDVARAARKRGVVVEAATGGGSHFKFKLEGFRTYPVTAHNGDKEEISASIIKKLCKHFSWDYESFKSDL